MKWLQMNKSNKKARTYLEGKRMGTSVARNQKSKMVLTISVFLLVGFHSLCVAQDHRITLGVGTGMSFLDEPSSVVIGNVLVNFNNRFSTGFELNASTGGLNFWAGKPIVVRGLTCGYLIKAKYYFKDSGTRFFASVMPGVYHVQYIIYDEYTALDPNEIPNQNLLGAGLELGVRFRRFQVSTAFHHTQAFTYETESFDASGDPVYYSFNPRYSVIQVNVGWNFGVL
jgi:hypothetical protein